MPVINAFRSGTRREVEKSATGRRIVEPWTVLVDAIDNVQEAINAPQLPADGTALVSDPTMRVARKRARAVSLYLWEIDVEYESVEGSTNNPNPTENEAVLNWTSVESSERIDIDLDEKPVVNTAYMPYEGGIEIEITDQVLSIQRYLRESDFDSKRQRDYKRAVNSDKFMHAEAGQARIVALDASFFKAGTTAYWDVRASVRFKDPADYVGWDASKLWYKRVVNEGYEEFLGLGPLPSPPFPPGIQVPLWRKIYDKEGGTLGRPALLKLNPDGTTTRLGVPSQSNPVQVNYFRVFKAKPFGSLALFAGLS